MLALDLLRYAAGEPTDPHFSAKLISRISEVPDREFAWLVDGGLGPLLYQVSHSEISHLAHNRRDALTSSELTAQVRYGALIDSTEDILDACADVGVHATLLKGISLSSQYYPSGHLRPMSDIDVLVPHEAYGPVESRLMLRGYERGLATHRAFTHHGIPLLHRARQVWVELHTALYPTDSDLGGVRIFNLASVRANSVHSTYSGRYVCRLTDELQLVYIASSWIRDLTVRRFHPSFLPALFDMTYLMKETRQTFDWDKLVRELDNNVATASLHVTLSWFAAHRLYAAPILAALDRRQTMVSRLELRLIHAALDRYLLGARRWRLPVPPPVPGRYNLRNQLRKRLANSRVQRHENV